MNRVTRTSRSARPSRASWAVVIFGAVIIGTAVLGTAGASLASAPRNDTTISVTIAPTGSDTPTSPGGSGGSPGGGPSETPSETPTASPSASPAPSPGTLVAVSGLEAQYLWSPNPADTRVRFAITVKNGSKSAFAAHTRFWVTGPVGNRVGTTETVEFEHLRPGQSRTVHATIRQLGQWTALTGHATVTPPRRIDGIAVPPVTRDTFVIVPPFLIAAGGALAAGGCFAAWMLWLRKPVALFLSRA